MIGFAAPKVLALLVVLHIGWYYFSRVQKRALEWIDGHVSTRFRRHFTVHSSRSMKWHLRLVLNLGLLLILAAARPVRWGETEAMAAGGKVLLLVDASASMWAEDVETMWREDQEPPPNRLRLTTRIAGELVESLDGYEFAVASYSGSAVIHIPAVADRQIVLEALATLESHTSYRNTGSSLVGALDIVPHFIDPDDPFLEVVIFGDGEMPYAEDYDPALEALVRSDIPVHSVVVGSLAGQGRIIFDMRDIVAGVEKEEWSVLQTFDTHRVDEHFKRISRRTGGRFLVVEESYPDRLMGELVDAVQSGRNDARRVEHEQVATELAPLALLLFLIGFLAENLWIGRLGRRSLPAFDVDQIGSPALAETRAKGGGKTVVGSLLFVSTVLLATTSGCGSSDRALAHRENELGLAQDAVGRHDAARPHFERSIAYGEDAEIPTYNLARSVTRKGDHSEAHELYQRALELDPEMVEAHHNDGVALYQWGKAERDPRDCELERTLELWIAARKRFATAAELAPRDSEPRARALKDHRYLVDAIAEIEDLIAEPPEHCRSQQESESSGQSEPPPGGEPPGGQDDPEPPPGGGGGGEPPAEEEQMGAGSSDRPLTGEELDQIRRELGRIAEQAREEGKFHRRTRPEQVFPEDWGDPEKVIRW